jgi:L-threonylcarbamoyladenylate synthase
MPEKQQVVLSRNGDFAEAARNLFAGMRYLDSLDLDIILAEPVPEMGLGRAINDRLKRAAALKED